jgi:hypothetical protein
MRWSLNDTGPADYLTFFDSLFPTAIPSFRPKPKKTPVLSHLDKPCPLY